MKTVSISLPVLLSPPPARPRRGWLAAVLGAGLAAAASAQTPITLQSPYGYTGGGFGTFACAVGDLNADGVEELWVSSYEPFSGVALSGRAYVYDGANLALLYEIQPPNPRVNAYGYFSAASAGDITGDGHPDLMAGYTTGAGRVDFFDGATGSSLFSLSSPNPDPNNGSFGKGVWLMPDLTGDGRPDWLIHQVDWGSRLGRAYLFDAQTRLPVTTRANYDAPGSRRYFWMQELEVLPDLDGDEWPELGVGCFQANLNSQSGRARVLSLRTGEVLYEFVDPEPQRSVGRFGETVMAVGDIDGDGIEDLAVGTHFKLEERGAVYLYSGADGAFLHNVLPPNPVANGRFGWRINRLGDWNGDGTPELWVQQDGLGLSHVFDGASGDLLQTRETPSAPGSLFFTTVLGRDSAPSVQGMVTYSEGAGVNGLVWVEPYTVPVLPATLVPLGFDGSGIRLQVRGQPSTRLTLEATTDLVHWTSVGEVFNQDGTVELQDDESPLAALRCYRATARAAP